MFAQESLPTMPGKRPWWSKAWTKVWNADILFAHVKRANLTMRGGLDAFTLHVFLGFFHVFLGFVINRFFGLDHHNQEG